MAEKLEGGLRRCPHCGASDVALDVKEGKLKCNYCKSLFDAKSANEYGGVHGMKGETRGKGAEDIIPGDDIVKTFKCPSCGAEVVINTDEALNANCHWCRHVFSVDDAVSNGAVPDLVLPFKITKEEAKDKIRKCISSRTEKLDKRFEDALDEYDIEGVYFPYMIVDVNARMEMKGVGEVNLDKNKTTPPWRVDEFGVERNFTILVDDLTIESSSARLNQDTCINSNNIINAILPFDTENAAAWNAKYLRGFSSEKRNVDVNKLKEITALQVGDIARRKAKELTTKYDRGIRWTKEHLGIKGTKWKAAYLPVWLFSYRDGISSRIYYVAVNARTGETVGCLPLASGIGHYVETENITRHRHEIETRASVEDVTEDEISLSSRLLRYNSEIRGRNDNRVIGSLSTGRSEMLAAERVRFENGRDGNWVPSASSNFYRSGRRESDQSIVAVIIIIVVLFFLILLSGGSGGGGSSSYDSDWGYDSSYDSGSWDSYDSGGYDSFDSGFDYSYDY